MSDHMGCGVSAADSKDQEKSPIDDSNVRIAVVTTTSVLTANLIMKINSPRATMEHASIIIVSKVIISFPGLRIMGRVKNVLMEL